MSTAVTVATILASAVVVFGGLVALMRAIWRIAQVIRDNTKATAAVASKLDGLKIVVDGRIAQLETRLADVERQIRRA